MRASGSSWGTRPSGTWPFLLEVPGTDGKGPGKADVDALKAIREELGIGG